jgi:N-acylglucosamine-6-phosphate 2-epimerase
MTDHHKDLQAFIERVRGHLIVSCQALPDEPLHGAHIMARMALAAQQGGAAGIRANGADDIRAIKSTVDLPVIGIFKDGDIGVYITPTFGHARAVSDAGADVIALDATLRPRPDGSTSAEIIRAIHDELGKPVMADVSTLEEAIAAQNAGADIVAPTLSGYTPYSPQIATPDWELIAALVKELRVPVIAEGRIHTPEDAVRALEIGAVSVVVGGAITRPQQITARFTRYIAAHNSTSDTHSNSKPTDNTD